jgi:hypothetical protein
MPNQILPVRTGGPADFRKTITNASIINMPRLSFVEHKNSIVSNKFYEIVLFIWYVFIYSKCPDCLTLMQDKFYQSLNCPFMKYKYLSGIESQQQS